MRASDVIEALQGYRCDDPPMEGWLCPALFRYFEAAPPELYVKAEERKA
jgi:hypothetical protein